MDSRPYYSLRRHRDPPKHSRGGGAEWADSLLVAACQRPSPPRELIFEFRS
jgi:hypothetical protein